VSRCFVTIMLVAILAGCAPATPPPAPQPQLPTQVSPLPTVPPTVLAPSATVAAEGASGTSEAVIVLKRSGGLAGKTEQWSIYSDGRTQSDAGQTYAAPAAQVSTLLAAVTASGFFDLEGSYGLKATCADCMIYELTVRSDGQVKTVTVVPEATGTPEQLTKVLDQINGFLASLPKG
jgi:hypothetical protein